MSNHGHQPTVLVVEDEAPLRRLIVHYLTSDGIASVEAGAADPGLSVVRQNPGLIDLAIIDMVMPGMSGLDLAAELGREFPGLKILFTSGYVDSIAMQGIAGLSPESVLFKPFTVEDLLSRVHKLLERA
jgi:DNA-binding response OmpR family regulator